MRKFTRHNMRQTIYILTLTFLTIASYGQTTIQTKEIKIHYTNGNEIFKICASGCVTTFDDKKEYFWYTEFSKIKSTKGGSGGNLLHGNYKFYDENGNLRQDKNYYLGLPDGTEKNWDSLGNITSQAKYNKGKMFYWKFQNDEKYWIEWIGPIFEQGTIKKVYTQYSSLISEETQLPNFKEHIKTYYEYSGKLKAEYTTSGIGGDYMTGKYISYFENGKIQTDGQFYEGEYTNIKIGTWKYYNSDGTVDATEQFKSGVEKWDNGELKIAGGYIYDTDNNTWLKTGEWRFYTEDGKFQSSKKYKWGTEVTE